MLSEADGIMNALCGFCSREVRVRREDYRAGYGTYRGLEIYWKPEKSVVNEPVYVADVEMVG